MQQNILTPEFLKKIALEGTYVLLKQFAESCREYSICTEVKKTLRKFEEKLREELTPEEDKLWKEILKICTELNAGKPLIITAEVEFKLRKLGLDIYEVCSLLSDKKGRRKGYRTKLYYLLKWLLNNSLQLRNENS